jgi:hypothetical protein
MSFPIGSHLTVTFAIESAITSRATPASAAGLPGGSNSTARNPGGFAAMCGSQLSSPENGNKASGPTMTLNGLQKPVDKTIVTNPPGTKNSGKNDPPVAADTSLISLLPVFVLVPVPLPITALYSSQPESPAGLSLPATGVNAEDVGGNQLGQSPQATLPGLPALLSATEPSRNAALNTTSGGTATPVASWVLHPESEPSQAPSKLSNVQTGISSNVLSSVQSAENSAAVPQNVGQPATSVAVTAMIGLSNSVTAEQVSLTSASGDPVSTSSVMAAPVPIPSQGQAASGDGSAGQSNRSDKGQASLDAAGVQSSIKTTPDNVQQGNVVPPALPSPPVSRLDLKPPAAPVSPDRTSTAAKQNSQIAQNSVNAFHTLASNAVSRSFDQLRPIQWPAAESIPATPPANPSSSFSFVAPTSALDANPLGTSANPGKNGIAPTSADSSVSSGAATQTGTTKGANSSQSGTSGGDTSDPGPQKGPSGISLAQSGNPPATSFQSAAIALADPAMQVAIQGATSQPAAPPGTAHRSDGTGPASSADSPSNLPASGEFLVNPSTGPVQMAQMVSKASQSEMRIGMNTSAFGNVEVRTVVHANEVSVVIGSEKGDLRSLLSNELPGIANELQRQDLKLNQVNFHQSGFAFSNQMSSGSESHARSFASKPGAPMAPPGPTSGAEFTERAEPLLIRGVSGLSILA